MHFGIVTGSVIGTIIVQSLFTTDKGLLTLVYTQ